MRGIILAACAVLTVLGVPCRAQVISGESTYEDNFEHDPPSASRETTRQTHDGTAAKDAGDKTDAPASRRQ